MINIKDFDIESMNLDNYEIIVENKVRDQSFKIFNDYVDEIRSHKLKFLNDRYGDNIPNHELRTLHETMLSMNSEFIKATMPFYQDLNNFVIKLKRENLNDK